MRTLVEIWAVPGDDFICLIAHQRGQIVGSTCHTTEETLSHGLAATFLSEPATGSTHTRRLIVGIAPDRTHEIIAYTPESATRIPVVAGIFIHSDKKSEPPDQLTLVRPFSR